MSELELPEAVHAAAKLPCAPRLEPASSPRLLEPMPELELPEAALPFVELSNPPRFLPACGRNYFDHAVELGLSEEEDSSSTASSPRFSEPMSELELPEAVHAVAKLQRAWADHLGCPSEPRLARLPTPLAWPELRVLSLAEGDTPLKAHELATDSSCADAVEEEENEEEDEKKGREEEGDREIEEAEGNGAIDGDSGEFARCCSSDSGELDCCGRLSDVSTCVGSAGDDMMRTNASLRSLAVGA